VSVVVFDDLVGYRDPKTLTGFHGALAMLSAFPLAFSAALGLIQNLPMIRRPSPQYDPIQAEEDNQNYSKGGCQALQHDNEFSSPRM
jgi:hypothetical protein